MSSCFAHIKMPFEPDTVEFAKFDCGLELGYTVKDHAAFDPRVNAWLAELGMCIAHTSLFHMPPNSWRSIHTDIPGMSDFAKLNICQCAPGSRMIWYKLKPSYKMPTLVPDDTKKYRTPDGFSTSYVSIPGSEAVPIASAKIHITWINASIPHSVMNNTTDRRWVISIPLRDIDKGYPIKFSEGVERFKEFL